MKYPAPTVRKNTQRLRRGLTLIELLVVLAMTVVIAVSVSFAFSAAFAMQRSQEAMRASLDQTALFERGVTRLLEGARLSGVTGDTTTFFQGLPDGGASEIGSDRVTFTTVAPGVPMKSASSQDDFETQQTAAGPVGGMAELSLGMTPVGDARDKTGLFQRLQRPPDGDPTQGGQESVLDADIASIGFQFWDGLEWVDTWDTTTMTPPRLPESVQVSYRRTSEPGGNVHVFVVPIFASDVTPQNPVTMTGATTVSAGTAQ